MDLIKKFSSKMGQLLPLSYKKTIAVAVSGGADSTALALLLKAWGEKKGIKIIALVVDHGLRENARDEARQVVETLEKQNIEAHLLAWHGEKPQKRLQERAREMRFQLLKGWCQQNGVNVLALGHHLDDVLETTWMRLSKKSGFMGLAGIADVVDEGDFKMIRPLLSFQKSELEAFLEGQGQSWVRDPSNENKRFERVRVRQVLSVLPSSQKIQFMGVLNQFRHYRAMIESVLSQEKGVFYKENAIEIVFDEMGIGQKLFLPFFLNQLVLKHGAKQYAYSFDKMKAFIEDDNLRKLNIRGLLLEKRQESIVIKPEKKRKGVEERAMLSYVNKREYTSIFFPL